MDEIIEITGDDLRILLEEMGTDTDVAPLIRIVRVTIDEGTFKLKVNEDGWTMPLGKPMQRTRR